MPLIIFSNFAFSCNVGSIINIIHATNKIQIISIGSNTNEKLLNLHDFIGYKL